jgi:1-acyl-sn-glycerol-3-phosphate acyltransferase
VLVPHDQIDAASIIPSQLLAIERCDDQLNSPSARPSARATVDRRDKLSGVSEKLSSLKAQVYTDPRPKEHFDRFHARARTRGPTFVYDLVRLFSALYALTLLRARVIAAQNVPETGAAILAPNHFSYMDHFLIGIFIRRKVRFMAKSQLFTRWAQWVYVQGGVFPVRRGARDNETFVTAEAILERGGVVAMYPEGGRSRTGSLAEQAKPGIGRLVLESGAPVVPIAIHGSSRIRNWKRLRFPRVRVQYGEPLHFEREPDATRERQQEVADAIFGEVRALYARLGGRLGG